MRIAGRDEPAGPHVILVHRLLKGNGSGDVSVRGFVLVTERRSSALRVDRSRLGMVSLRS